jgi:mRNA-degrading endonuclease RelE of RelBE toxin-antitoxin system
MSFKIVPTPHFKKQFKRLEKKYKSLPDDFLALIDSLSKNPSLGIPLGQNVFKIRIAIRSKGKGKSGGARVITCAQIIEKKVFLLAIYDKSEEASISERSISQLLRAEGLA